MACGTAFFTITPTLNKAVRALFLGLLLLTTAQATTYRDVTLEQMSLAADLVFFGEVRDIRTELRDGDPWTLVTFTVKRGLRGNLLGAQVTENEDPKDEVVLAFYGGTVRDIVLEVDGMPSFALKEEILIFAYDQPYYSPIVGFNQGLWRFDGRRFINEIGTVVSVSPSGQLTTDEEFDTGSEELLEVLKSELFSSAEEELP